MKLPNLSFERKLWKKDYKFVCGIDEVGRGCFAGPVFAAAVVFPADIKIEKITINDSKKLSAKKREEASKWIKKNAVCWGVGMGTVAQINKLGIVKATEIAFRKAINSCKTKPDFLLIDAFYIPYVKGLRRKKQLAIVKGDTKSISIAAASILAKVERDKYMVTLGKNSKYRKYGWVQNKGYGTEKHQLAIKKHGITKLHRKAPVSHKKAWNYKTTQKSVR